MHINKKPEATVAVLHNEVVPFYKNYNIKIQNIFTDNGSEFKGTEKHPYEIYLELNDIKHRTTQVRKPQTNEFIERFNRTVLDEFFRINFRQKYYETLHELQNDLDLWLKFYNYQRPHQGYRNMGKKPFENILKFVIKETSIYSYPKYNNVLAVTLYPTPYTVPLYHISNKY